MLDLSRTHMSIAAGVAGTLFLGYCIYFDQKRRKDPDFKRKLRQRRMQAKQTHTLKDQDALPNLKDRQAVQKYFLQQIQLGEELLNAGNLDEGIEHFGRAIAFCGQARQLLEVLQQSLPAPVFHLLLQRLPTIVGSFEAQRAQIINDDDLE